MIIKRPSNKNFLLLIALILSSGFSCLAQYRPAVAGLKTGDSLVGIIGDVQRKVFKYKTQSNGKSIKLDFEKLNYVKIMFDSDDIRTYRFFRLEDDKDYKAFQQLAKGKNAELYGVTRVVRSSGFAGPAMDMNAIQYYIKKPTEKNLTLLGLYDPLINNLKNKVLAYFADCKELIQKIENKDFRMRNGLTPMVDFYNSNCNSSQL